jgi:hypothetical protein
VGASPRNLPLTLSICQIDPNTAQCINPTTPGPSATVTMANGEFAHFGIFAQPQGQFIATDPANNRVYVIPRQGSTAVGQQSVALKMLSPGPGAVAEAGK